MSAPRRAAHLPRRVSIPPNVEPGDVIVLPDGQEALVTARVEAGPGPLAGLLEVAVTPTPLTSDDSLI